MTVPSPPVPSPPVPPTPGPITGQVPLEHRVLVLWRLRIALALGVLIVITGVIVTLTLSAVVALASVLVLLGFLGGAAWWWTALVWRSWRFEVGESALHLRHGVVTTRASTIPYHRVQHIDLESGPLERRLRLATLVLRTASASSDSTVPGIDADDAEVLRRRILALVGTGDAT